MSIIVVGIRETIGNSKFFIQRTDNRMIPDFSKFI